MQRRSVPEDYDNSRADKVGLLAMVCLLSVLNIVTMGADLAAIFALCMIAVWPVADGYIHREVIRP